MRTLPNRLLLLLIVACVTVLSDTIPEDFVRVTKYCPESLSAFGEILILSDKGETPPYAFCRGREYSFVQICAGVYRLRFHHSGDPDEGCLSTLPIGEDQYTVQVNLPVDQGLVTLHSKTKIVRCPMNFQRPPMMILSRSDNLVFQSNQSTPAQNQSQLNDLLLADPMMNFEEAEPEPIVRISIQARKLADSLDFAKLRIYSLMNNPHMGIKGISPIKCDLSYNSGVTVIIDNGCSNGSVIPINTGFEVQGIMSWSPVFVLPIPNDFQVSVSCSFGVCKNKCDGSSCRRHQVEIIDVYNASARLSLTFPYEFPEVLPKLEDVRYIPGLLPPLENDVSDTVDKTTNRANPNTSNISMIIALGVLVPVVCILLVTTCWYRSKVNFGAYRVRNSANP